MIYIRKKPKGFGQNQQIEGHFKEKQKTILIEDLATDGGSKIIFIEAIRKAKLIITDIFVIFYYDIFDFKKSSLSNYQVNLHSLCTWKDIIDIIKIKKLIAEEEGINVLVLAANTNENEKNPGPIINALISREISTLRIPVMIVPGNFSKDHISQIT